jgi:lipid-binding SYLF domain-containing protein
MELRKTHIAAFAAAALLGTGVAAYAGEKEEKIQQDRQRLTEMAEQAMSEVIEKHESVAELRETAYGYAVFDATKGGLFVVGVGGTGIAMPTHGGKETFMHVGGAGIGLAVGSENFRIVLLLGDQETFDRFVHGEWHASFEAQPTVGRAGAAVAKPLRNRGIKAYRLTGAGLMSDLDVSELHFWPSHRLNED